MASTTALLALTLTLGAGPAIVAVAGPNAAPPAQEASSTVEEAPASNTDTDTEAEMTTLSFDQIFASPRIGEWPKQLEWSPDGQRLTYLMPAGKTETEAPAGEEDDDESTESVELWSLDVTTGEPSLWFESASLPPAAVEAATDPKDEADPKDAAEEAEPEAPEARSIDAYQFTPSGGLLIESSGDLFTLQGDGPPRHVLGKDDAGVAPAEPKLSPDGKSLAYLRGPDLFVNQANGGAERALTHDGKEGEILNGQTDWVYWEEIFGRASKGFWWSPDSRRIVYYRFDDRKVPIYTLLDFSGQYPEAKPQRYPKAGTTNPTVTIGVVDVTAPSAVKGKRGKKVETAKTVWLDTGAETDVYLARVDWMPDGEHVAVQRLNRDQNRLDLLRCSAVTGACTTLLTESSETWVNVGNELTFLKDGRFIWSSESTGWKHLYLHAADGTLIRPLTQGQWSVTGLLSVDEAGERVIFTAPASPSAGYVHHEVWQASLGETLTLSPLTNEAGWHTALVAPGGKHWVRTISTGDQPPVRVVMGPDGRPFADLPAGPAPTFDPASLPQWEYIFIWGLDGSRLPARMLKPPVMDPEKKYPVIMYHYGCPESQTVANRWGGPRDLWHKMMAQRGYVIFNVDNTSSAFFGKRGADKDHRLFGPINLLAQEAGIEFLKTQPYVDPARIGIWGWSGGGSSTLGALLAKPGLWKAGVAGAPVTDWLLYDTIWTERYLDHPDDNPEGYKKSSPVHMAANLKDHLLLVHGTSDDNVHPQNTLMMSKALIEAGIPFEQAIYPGQKHGFRGKASRHFYERMTEFFDRWLAEP